MRRYLLPLSGDIPRTLTGLRREMDSLFENFFGEGAPFSGEPFAPSTNVAETESGFEVTVEVPGLKADDFEIELQEGQLTIRGEKRPEVEETKKTYHRVERHFGQFQRVIPLATPIKEEEIAAEYQDGVLTISIPKAEAVKPKRISVKG